VDTHTKLNASIHRWYFLPALLWLVVAVAVGTWIRFEWHSPSQSFFAIPNLIHAHTHAALLGWVYLVMGGFTLKHFINKKTAARILLPMSVGLQLSNLGMLVSFALQGYGFWGIFFSSTHLFLTLWLAVLFLWRPDKSQAGLSKDLAAAAWLWQVLSGFGPFALAFTGGMSGTMAQFWLGSYLFLMLNGWIIFMLLSIWFHQPGLARRVSAREKIGFNLMFITLLPALISMLYGLGISRELLWLGFGANLLHGAGLLMLLPVLWPGKATPLTGRLILRTGLLLLAAKAVIQPVSYFPDLLHLTTNHLLKVGFLHMVLLGLVTPVLLYLGYSTLQKSSPITLTVALLSVGSGLLTTAILFWIPLAGMAGIFVFWPWQLLMGIAGVAVVTAACIMIALQLNRAVIVGWLHKLQLKFAY